MSSSAGRLSGLIVLGLCLAAMATPIMTARAGTAAPAAVTLQDFESDADFYEGVETARLDRGDRDDRGDRVGLRLAAASSAVALRPAAFARRVVSTINVTATDRPITCTFGLASTVGGLWDFTYDTHIFNPNDVPIAHGTRWANDKGSFRGALTTTLTDPIVVGTYRCVIEWHVANSSTGESTWLPPNTVGLPIAQ